MPGIAFFETDLYYRTDRFTGDTSSGGNVFSRTVVMTPITVGGLKLNFAALLLINKRKDAQGTEVFLQPDLTVPIGSTGLEVGWRQERHQYKNYTRNTPTLIAK